MSPPELGTSLRPQGIHSETSVLSHPQSVSEEYVSDNIKLQRLISEYRSRGHAIANLDPLGIQAADLDMSIPHTLKREYYNFSDPNVSAKIPPNELFSGTGSFFSMQIH